MNPRFKIKNLRLILIGLSFFFLSALFLTKVLNVPKTNKVSAGYGSAQIYISGGDSKFASAGLIPLASTDAPEVSIGGYNISGSAAITIYKADFPSLLDYLTHDKDNKQTKAKPDISKFQFVGVTSQDITGGYEGTKISLPLGESGIWYLKIKVNDVEADAYILRSNFAVLAKKSATDFILWGQNFKTKRSITEGNVQVYSLLDGQKVIQNTSFDSSGIAKANLSTEADLALVKIGNDLAIVPLNLMYLNSGASWSPFAPSKPQTKYFTFTDRPIYKPGDTVYFKSVLRNDDDARYSIPSGTANVKIYSGYYYYGYGDSANQPTPIYETTLGISPEGTINGQFKIPDAAKVGYYSLAVFTGSGSQDSTGFDVEYYQKPEYYINVDSANMEYTAGDNGSFKISGFYFSGQPLANQVVKYSVSSSDFYEYDYLSDLRYLKDYLNNFSKYSFGYGSHKVTEGVATLDSKGQAVINLPTKMDFNSGKSQIFTVEATLEDNSQTPAMSRKNIIVYAGEFGIYRSEYSYGAQINTNVKLPISLASLYSDKKFPGVNLTAKIKRETWEKYQDTNQKYPQYKKVETDFPALNTKTDSNGNAILSFIPDKVGLYKITVEGKDSRGNTISKLFNQYIWQDNYPYYSSGAASNLTILFDKKNYEPADTVQLSVYSEIPDRDVFVSLERGRIDRYQIVHLNGKAGTLQIPLKDSDIPNMFVKLESFSDNSLDSAVDKFNVSTNSKRVLVNIAPDAKKYGPSDNVTLDITTKDANGYPVPADVAVWVVDKSIFELSDNNLGDIFDTYWSDRYDNTMEAHSLEGITVYAAEQGGCFAAGTKILMADGTSKNIEDIKAGDKVRVDAVPGQGMVYAAKVSSVSKAFDNGYLIINGQLKVTPDHVIWINNAWNTASTIQLGDKLTDKDGKPVVVNTLEWQKGKFDVYNLDVEKYHNFYADGVLVHNQKGDGARTKFADAAYWNPSVRTDQNGKARLSFKLPDNLTTWTVSAVADTSETKVGQATAEIISTKDVVVRPILPNILRVGDTLEVSALVQNFTDKDHAFDISLKFDSGSVTSQDFNAKTIASGSMERLFWEIKPEKENLKGKLTFTAIATDNKKLNDIVALSIPVKDFEFEEKRGESGLNNKTYTLNIPEDVNISKSSSVLSLASSMIGTLPSAMSYLVHYPYGCTEQTATSLSAALVAKYNQDVFAGATKDKDLDDIIRKGIARVSNQQQPDGGFTWWFTGPSNIFVTSYVIENLLAAQKLGFEVDPSVLGQAKIYLEKTEDNDSRSEAKGAYSKADWAIKDYGLALLGGSTKAQKITDFNGLSPDILSLLVMANYMSGDTNPVTNGLNQLQSLSKSDGNGVYWDPGSKLNFGSKDASSGMAIRAIAFAHGDTDLAKKAVVEIIRSRKYDYWSNTYGTMQVIHGILDLARSQGDLNPNLSYKVSLDGSIISSGTVTGQSPTIKDIRLPLSKTGGSASLNVNVNGTGDLYSTLVTNLIHTDKNAGATGNIISIEKEYINDKGSEYNLAPGDSVRVNLTVNWPNDDEKYAVITDELPSGLSPINIALNNQRYGIVDDYSGYFTSNNVTGMDVTQNGVVMSVYRLTKGSQTFTYHARVIASGDFSVPPATVSLMYSPEIYARTKASNLTISRESIVTPRLTDLAGLSGKKINKNTILFTSAVIAAVISTAFIIWKTKILTAVKLIIEKLFKKTSIPPPPQTGI